MASLTWAQHTEQAIGRGHPTLTDTVNRALREILELSGYDPDATDFLGLAGPVANVKAFGALGDNSTNDSAAIQEAIDTGLPVYFPDGIYHCAGLTQDTDQQRFLGAGKVMLVKNANGTILASTGDHVVLQNIQFRGEASTPVFTGDNVTFTGENCAMVNCGSRYAFGRAVKATGGHFQILGTCDIYQTADTSATGYDVEIGVSGTATLYHNITAIYTSQATGGILFVDCGGQSVVGSTFGKLTVESGTSPAGVNGGKYVGNRILGDVTVEISNAQFSANQFAVIDFTIAASVTGVNLDVSNLFQSGATLTNSGGGSNALVRSVGASGDIELKYGGDASEAVLKITPTTGRFTFPDAVVLANTMALILQDSGAGDGASLSMNASGDVFFTNTETNRTIAYQTTGTSSGARHQFAVNGGSTVKAVIDNTGICAGASGSPAWQSGSGAPEGAVTAVVGSLWSRTDGGASTTLYVKESGAGNTGWKAVQTA